MSIRTVPLDEESEKALQKVMERTGLSASAALKKGIVALSEQLEKPAGKLRAAHFREYLLAGGAGVWHMDDEALTRALQLMARYAAHPMDLADASLAAAAERLNTLKVFTIDRNDFSTNRARRGRQDFPIEIIG